MVQTIRLAAYACTGEWQTLLREGQQARERTRQNHDWFYSYFASCQLGQAAIELGDLIGARVHLQHAVAAAENAGAKFAEGMQKAGTLRPDLILLDIDMPEVSGFELCQRLKADPNTSPIPIRHPFGDRVLQVVGDCFSVSMRSADAACRFGGDEFAIILSDMSLEGGLVVMKRIREQLASLELQPKGERVTITASIGIACTEQFTMPAQITVSALLGAADRALYAAKRAGRDRICAAETPIAAADEPPLEEGKRPTV